MPYKSREDKLAYMREYAKKNKEKRKEYLREYAKRPENKARIRANADERRSRDPEKARQKQSGYNKRYAEKHKAKIASHARYKSTGWTPEAYQAALLKQEGKCAICGKVMLLGGTKADSAHADHCHLTNTPRAILCHHCNVGLGYFGDDVERLQEAIAYLKRHANKEME